MIDDEDDDYQPHLSCGCCSCCGCTCSPEWRDAVRRIEYRDAGREALAKRSQPGGAS